ncbi:hypothetical protein ABB37_08451 [Leptomonas pyrrhocoris]|uniref:Uncharacterized protein n=1 Tax=Leptomonas pyrrhocoris TaxID=157538 RepID=A0A0M9FTE4_LEPPY|nr:hypothetical protein ABB37_08451 [Leptomonas pyrrhocoris]XP_015654007.1 hypothetical protein ABB37_08451 [Leptomonas pyrrhocoris]XP_015654008.1 hypothetical protein ABB37_08451 [Leptomonas pyrrhocoris]KPA75567.1 hypothetical protein ABB37_08451 [Leptomonas pyrrhocoris]KPA75568.1 hypothetical protein ABB37_08451 [Leptomonas pyrrhocoris]KPA75569.1 hypothetical protein ABB37_08451 [Leptomonas pyrrhocoris]|eukprot:XP_015654006.1 hypothetical protein ABB37_08451 [Leptomonas pyrrhocoris]
MDPHLSKAQKPYVPIDTCSPGGTWVEERRYNRVRPTAAEYAATLATSSSSAATVVNEGASKSIDGGAAPPPPPQRPRRVLCGNWQEEDALERDLLAIQVAQQQQQQQTADSTQSAVPSHMQTLLQSGWSPSVTTEVITQQKNGHYTGGHTSTPYLTCDPQHPNLRDLDSTYHVDYNATNGDVSTQQRPALGVRSQRLMEQALAAAREMKAANDAARQRQLVESEMNVSNASRAFGPNISEYRATMCDAQEVLPVVEELATDYQDDEPITVYTGNPHTGKTMTVHGKTPVDPMSSSRFGKHTHFTENKYAY